VTIKHILTKNGWITEALYEVDGKSMCARLDGTLNKGQVHSLLGIYRRQASDRSQ
jgi:hypothetical protein